MKQSRSGDSSSSASPASKRRRASPLNFWCDSFDRPKHLVDVLKRWVTSEHRVRHARGSLEKGDAVPPSLLNIITTMEAAMMPIPHGTELYFATYDSKWKYNAHWWLPCSRTHHGAEKAVRHLHHDPPAGARLHVHKLVLAEGISGVWCGDLGLEHDDEEEVVLAAGLHVTRIQGGYRVTLPDPKAKKTQHAHAKSAASKDVRLKLGRAAKKAADAQETASEAEDDTYSDDGNATVSVDDLSADDASEEAADELDAEPTAEQPASAGWSCVIS